MLMFFSVEITAFLPASRTTPVPQSSCSPFQMLGPGEESRSIGTRHGVEENYARRM